MNLKSKIKLAAEFCIDSKSTINYVINNLLPALEKELAEIDDCELQYAACGLPPQLSDIQEELREAIANCNERLKHARLSADA